MAHTIQCHSSTIIVTSINRSDITLSCYQSAWKQRNPLSVYQLEMRINDAIIIIDTRLVQVRLDVDAALMIGGVSLLCHHNKVINIIANLCVCVCVWGISWARHSYTLHNFHLLLDLVWRTACFQKCRIEKIQLCKSTKLKKSNFAKCNRKFEKLQDGWPF